MVDPRPRTGEPRVEGSAHQLDLFRDSREVSLVNAVVAAFQAGDCASVRHALTALRAEAPERADLTAFDALLAFLEKERDTDFAALDSGCLEQRIGEIDAVVASGTRALGSAAKEFLNRIWRRLASAAARHPYDRARPQTHAAALFLRAAAHAEAEAAAAGIADGWNDPVVLRWRALARCRLGGLPAARWQTFSLAWFAADSFPERLAELAAPQLESDWRRFQSAVEVPDASWFPAWCLLAHPEIAAALAGEISPQIRQAAAGIRGLRAFLVLKRILAVEPGGYSRALIEERARLQAIDATFFAAYMRSRAVQHR